MPYNEILANRLREELSGTPDVTEKKMFSGIAFLVDEKLCICAVQKGLMCRIDPADLDELMHQNGVQPMVMRGKEMKGYVVVDEDAVKSNAGLRYWIKQCLRFNPKARQSKKKKSNA